MLIYVRTNEEKPAPRQPSYGHIGGTTVLKRIAAG
jgi:hypothetical protein